MRGPGPGTRTEKEEEAVFHSIHEGDMTVKIFLCSFCAH